MKNLYLGTAVLAFMAGQALAQPAEFPTPQDAFDALLEAVDTRDEEAFKTVMGQEGLDLVQSDDKIENRVNRAVFLGLVSEGYRFRRTEEGVEIVLGEESWPFPIPLSKTEDGWSFDIEEGREEILVREIGRNELTVMDMLLAYVDLQAQFREVDHDGDGVMEFAGAIISDADARDGLFWPGSNGPVGAALARADFDGWSDGTNDFEPEPFVGYYFSVLKAQGDAAPGGSYSYEINGNMVAGHAMLAVPADYGESGVHSFMIAENGQLFEADLGEDTLITAGAIEAFDPSADWVLVDDVEGVN